MVLLPVLIAVVVRLGFPVLVAAVRRQFDFDLLPYADLLIGFLIVTLPVLFGMVIGFLLLDQRDDHTLVALQVTPLSLSGYFAYRTGMPMLLSFLAIVITLPFTGLPGLTFQPLLISALVAAPLAPFFALGIASFAENKVQGFALSKASGVLLIPPLVAYFLPGNWQFLLGIVPTYWASKVYWTASQGDPTAWIYLVVGLVYQAVLLFVLLRRFNRIMTR
jgi:fluoroquinolone transport system permease protein